VSYVPETWVLKENIIQKLLVFERKILRGICGPTKENQTWRIENNEELDKLIKQENRQIHNSPETKLVQPCTKNA